MQMILMSIYQNGIICVVCLRRTNGAVRRLRMMIHIQVLNRTGSHLILEPENTSTLGHILIPAMEQRTYSYTRRLMVAATALRTGTFAPHTRRNQSLL